MHPRVVAAVVDAVPCLLYIFALLVALAGRADGSDPPAATPSTTLTGLWQVYSHALPTKVFALLVKDVSGVSVRTAPPVDGRRVSRWFDFSTAPTSALELGMLHLHSFLSPARSFAGCEWWTERRPHNVSLPFAVEKDEALAADSSRVVHPSIASILYTHQSPSPSLITHQRLVGGRLHPPRLSKALYSVPAVNSLVVFNGSLLHGVVGHEEYGERIVLRMNFWTERPGRPDCEDLRMGELTGLHQLAANQIARLQAELRAYAVGKVGSKGDKRAVRQRVQPIALHMDGHSSAREFTMEVRGGLEQQSALTLPTALKPGETYALNWGEKRRLDEKPAESVEVSAGTHEEL